MPGTCQERGDSDLPSDHIRWVFFDLGNTLIDESKPIADWITQLIRVLQENGFHATADDINRAFLETAREFAPKLIPRTLEILIGDQLDISILLGQVRYKKALEQPYPGTETLLCTLSERFRLGIIANQPAGTKQRLSAYGLLKYFQVCLSSTEERLEKPDPAIFERALSKAGCLPGEAVMVGDRLDNDIAPAHRLGWETIRVLQGFARVQEPRSDMEKAHHVVRSIGEITGLLCGGE